MKKIFKHKITGYLAIENTAGSGYLVDYLTLSGNMVSVILPKVMVEQDNNWADVTYKQDPNVQQN